MESYYGILMLLLFFIFLIVSGKKKKTIAIARHIQKRKRGMPSMETLAREFIGKECIIYTITSNGGDLQGIIREVINGGMLIEDQQGRQQAINLEYVTRIREFPRNKKGKKKNIVLD